MNILFITRKYPPLKGGMESLSFNLTTRYPEANKKILALGRRQMHLIWFFPFCVFYLLFRARKYDMVHVSDMVLVSLGFFAKALKRQIKVAVNVHGLDLTFAESTGILSKFYKHYLSFFARESWYDLLVCNSRYTEGIAKRFGLTKTVVIPVGVPLFTGAAILYTHDALLRRIGEEHRGKKILLTVGRLVQRKGVRWCIASVLPRLSPDTVYVVAGEGRAGTLAGNTPSSGEAALIREEIVKQGLQERVVLLGKVSEEELELLYHTADVFVMPNISVAGDVEGFGIVAVEASARGLPVVASRLEGVAEAVTEGENGFLVESENPQAFASQIERILRMSSPLALKERVRTFTQEHYSWAMIVAKYQRSFEQLFQKTAS